MKNSIKIQVAIVTFIIATLLSCNKFLEVSPVDQFLEDDIVKSEESLFKSLNGIYLNIAKPELYGGHLSMSSVDVMAQYYSYNYNSRIYPLAEYEYDDNYSKRIFNAIWRGSYTAILNINSFIKNINKEESVISEESKKILLGEAYALRAYLHFDLLRIFGPIYSTDPMAISIPYMSHVTSDIQPLLSANSIIDSVLSDLGRAEKLLEKDLIRTNGVVQIQGLDDNDHFFKLRNRRLNYYAVLGEKARVLLYIGDKKGAYTAAKQVITEGSKWFPWSDAQLSLPSSPNPDRIFSSEVIFGVKNYDMYNMQRDLFNMNLTDDLILVPFDNALNSLYDNNLNDYRLRINWTSGIATGKAYKTFIKYEDIANKSMKWRNLQPLLRISELYFIVAECSDNETEALAHLNAVRKNRGLSELQGGADLNSQLEKEYYRELWGEGQLFFYLKRKNKTLIPNIYGELVPMDKSTYVVPLPDSEINNRQ